MLFQIVSLAGAGMILAAYAASQLGRMNRQSALYLCLNLAGSTILTVSALRARSLGLTALEGAWALISLGALIRSRFAG